MLIVDTLELVEESFEEVNSRLKDRMKAFHDK